METNDNVRAQVESKLIREAWAEPKAGIALRENPEACYRSATEEAGQELDASLRVELLEESENVLYLVIPDGGASGADAVRGQSASAGEGDIDERSTRAEFEAHLVSRAQGDADYATALLEDPKKAYQELLSSIRSSSTLPEDLAIEVRQEREDLRYLRLPIRPADVSGELMDAELEAVAGGKVAVAVSSVVTIGAVSSVVLIDL